MTSEPQAGSPANGPKLPAGGGPAALHSELQAARERLQQQRRRVRTGIWVETLGVIALLLVAYAVPTLLTDRFLRLEWIFRAVLLASFVLVVARIVRRRLMQPLVVALSDEEIALAVERRSPELEQMLISSLQFEQDLQRADATRSIESRELKSAVVTGVRQRLESIPFRRAIDAGRVRRFALGIVTMLVFFVGWSAIDAQSLGIWASRNVLLSNTDWPRYTTLSLVGVADGVVRLPEGDPLTVRISVEGPMPDQMFLDYRFADGDAGTEPMSRTGDREFSWDLDAVIGDLVVTAQGGDSLPAELRVQIVERPRVEDLSIRVALPPYMEREPFDVPATEGDLRLPAGAELTITGSSQKPLQSAFLLFGNARKQLLALGDDGRSFQGTFAPAETGLLVVDVIDTDQLGAGAPPKLLLRVGEDKPPTIDYRLRGIGPSITAHVRIPGAFKVRDDFGLRQVGAVMRAVEDKAIDRAPDGAATEQPAEVPWQDAQARFDTDFTRSILRYEAEASVDLTNWNKVPDEKSPENPIRPGMLFSLRFWAHDNFGPGDPHEGSSEVMTFRVVTREQMVDELQRRQIEQRAELETILEEEKSALLVLSETMNPQDAGAEVALVKARYKALARQQQALGRRVRFVGEAYQRILWEYENNRLIEANKVRQIEAVITAPLEQLAKEAFPFSARLVDGFSRSGDPSVKNEAVASYREIIRRLEVVLAEMEQAETIAALIEQLRNVINLEKDAIDDVKTRLENRENDIFKKKGKRD